jgi:hypothetical protein
MMVLWIGGERQHGVTTAKRQYGPRSLAAPLAKVTRPIMRRRGLASAHVVSKWGEIMGPQMAAQSIPQRYVPDRQGGGTLHVRVGGGWATEFQHLEPQIIERINTFFGYRAVSRLVLKQGPVPQREKRLRNVEIADDGAAPPVAVDDEALRAALQRLGRAVRNRPKRESEK